MDLVGERAMSFQHPLFVPMFDDIIVIAKSVISGMFVRLFLIFR